MNRVMINSESERVQQISRQRSLRGQRSKYTKFMIYSPLKPYRVPYERHFNMLSGDVINFPIGQSIGELWVFQLVWGRQFS
jgi:hypothetical protein